MIDNTWRTGSQAHWAPDGWLVWLDTSWDHRGAHLACREEDVVLAASGDAANLGSVTVRDGAQVLSHGEVWRLAPPGARDANGGLGVPGCARLSRKEAEYVLEGQ